MSSVIPTVNAGEAEPNLIQKYLNDPSKDRESKKEIMRAISNGDEDIIFKSLQDRGYQ